MTSSTEQPAPAAGFALHKYLEYRMRVWLGRAYSPKLTARLDHQMLGGSGYGGWPSLLARLDADSVVYSVGVGFDIGFDLDLIAATGASVLALDPTPDVIGWISEQASLPSQFQFHPVGLAWQDGELAFAPPQRPDAVSGTLVAADGVAGHYLVPVKRLATLMQEFGHQHIDLLKLDIEGAEYQVIDDMLASGIYPDQLLVEFHHGKRAKGRYPVAATHARVCALQQLGYCLFWASHTGRELAFARLDAS